MSKLLGIVLLSAWAGAPIVAGADTSSTGEGQRSEASKTAPEVFATVGESVITQDEYKAALQRAMRKRFYHFKPPEGQQRTFEREIAQDLIDRMLLVQEAARRGIKADEDRIAKQLASYEQRYAGNPRWEKEGAQLLESLKGFLETQDTVKQLEAQARDVPAPTDAQMKQYYDDHLDKFMEPEQQRLSLILLKVDPSAARAVWDAAMTEAGNLVERLRNGADFAELARLHSTDASAGKGGDMGYLHRGMLSAEAEAVADKLSEGEVSDPVRVLEGVAILRLVERKPALQRDYDQVRDRARELWVKEQSDRAWQALIDSLRASTKIEIHDPNLKPHPPEARTNTQSRIRRWPLTFSS